jgi:hypothetical protein
MPASHGVAAAIAEQQLEAVVGLPRGELARIVGASVEALVMGEDMRPYLASTVVVGHAAGEVGVHVSVSTSGWDRARDTVAVRSVILLPDPAAPAWRAAADRTYAAGVRRHGHRGGSMLTRVRSWYQRR